MPFTPRDAGTIRTTILANRAARYRALGLELSVVKDSDAYIEADAYSLEQELLEQRALALTGEIFPDTASLPMLMRHAALIGLSQKPPTAAVLSVIVTGAPGTTSSCVGKTLNAADSTKYTPVDATNAPLQGISVDSFGNATVRVLSQSTGSATNKPDGTILTWSSAPTGFHSTATVQGAPLSVGLDAESEDALRARVLQWWAERPGSGNRADVVNWATSRTGITSAMVYPVTHATFGPGTPGAFRVMVLGDPSVRSVPSPFGVGADNITDVINYLLGNGPYAADGGQVTCNISPGDVDVNTPTPQVLNVNVLVTLGPGYSFPFTAQPFTVATGSSNTVVQTHADPTGTVHVGDNVAISNPAIRGGWEIGVVSAVARFQLTLVAPLSSAPAQNASIRPAPANWGAIRDAILAVFDRLGPGDVDTTVHPESARWPTAAMTNPATLYKSALEVAAMGLPGLPGAPAGVPGVVSAQVTAPAANLTPAPFTQLVPGTITLLAA